LWLSQASIQKPCALDSVVTPPASIDPAEAAGVDVEHKMLIAAIDVHSVTAK
jgi:hypothetical protein